MTGNDPTAERLYAVVHAGPSATRYARSGSGTTVVLLLTRLLDHDPVGAALFAETSKAFRVIAPELPARDYSARVEELREVAAWMRDFMDGLGIDRAVLVMDEALALSTLGFTLGEADRIAGIALLARTPFERSAEFELCVHALTQAFGTVLRYTLGDGAHAAVDGAAALQQFVAAI